MANWACFFFSQLIFIYTYTFCTYPEMRTAFWLLGGANGRTFNLYWVLPPTLLCTCSCHHTHAHAHAHTCTHTLSYTYAHSCIYGQTFLSWLFLPTIGISNQNAYNRVCHFIDIRSFTWFQFPVVVTGMDSQLEKVYMSMHTSTCTSLVQHLHTEVLCMLPIVFHDCISHALYRNNLHAMCNHSHATMLI